MRALIASVAAAALIASPVFAQTTNTSSSPAGKPMGKTTFTKRAKSTTRRVTTKPSSGKSHKAKNDKRVHYHKTSTAKSTSKPAATTTSTRR